MTAYDIQILATAFVVSSSCALLGCFLVLRRMAMVGDAISHAILPGIVIAFLVSGSRDSVLMLLGASLVGILTTFLVEYFHRRARLQTDAAIGVTFTSLFAVGVLMVSLYAGKVDLDQDCVLYGELAYVPLELISFGEGIVELPKALVTGIVVLAAVVLFILIGYRHLQLTTFDSAFAAATGVATGLWHYLLMGAVSVTTVASFESVGAILVVALLVAPAATAYLFTDNLRTMLWLSVVFGCTAATGGFVLAVALDGSIAGAIAAFCGLQFGLALVFAPAHGLVSKRRKRTFEARLQLTDQK